MCVHKQLALLFSSCLISPLKPTQFFKHTHSSNNLLVASLFEKMDIFHVIYAVLFISTLSIVLTIISNVRMYHSQHHDSIHCCWYNCDLRFELH